MVECTVNSLGGGSATSRPIDIKALPPEQSRINRPCPRTQHRYTDREDRQADMKPHFLSMRRIEKQCDPDLVEADQSSHCRRPQTGKEKDSACARNQVLYKSDRFRGFSGEPRSTKIDQRDTEAKPEQ